MIDELRKRIIRIEEELKSEGASESDIFRLFSAYKSGCTPDQSKYSKLDLDLRWEYYHAIEKLKFAESRAFEEMRKGVEP